MKGGEIAANSRAEKIKRRELIFSIAIENIYLRISIIRNPMNKHYIVSDQKINTISIYNIICEILLRSHYANKQ